MHRSEPVSFYLQTLSADLPVPKCTGTFRTHGRYVHEKLHCVFGLQLTVGSFCFVLFSRLFVCFLFLFFCFFILEMLIYSV